MPAYDRATFDPPAAVALVTLRNPATGQTCDAIPMLIDSGADVTMIPERGASAIGMEVTSGSRYELVGVEGTSTSAPAVFLELRFLHWTFRGQFLITRQEYGILGRNVMNNVSLLLDGPRQIWEEHK